MKPIQMIQFGCGLGSKRKGEYLALGGIALAIALQITSMAYFYGKLNQTVSFLDKEMLENERQHGVFFEDIHTVKSDIRDIKTVCNMRHSPAKEGQ